MRCVCIFHLLLFDQEEFGPGGVVGYVDGAGRPLLFCVGRYMLKSATGYRFRIYHVMTGEWTETGTVAQM